MWLIEDPSSGSTNTVKMPVDGIISVTKPDSVTVYPTVNGAVSAVHHVHVKAGDTVHFKLKNEAWEPTQVTLEYNGTTSTLEVPAAKYIAQSAEGNIMTTADGINLFANPAGSATGGAMGAGLGAGLLGGVLGGALLNGNGGGLFGNRNGGDTAASTLVVENAIAANERLTNARFDAQAQRDIESSIERASAAQLLSTAVGNAALGVEIAKGQGDVATQNALNAAALGVQIQKTAGETQTMLSLQASAIGVQNEKTATANALATALAQRDTMSQASAIAAATAAAIADSKYTLATAIKADGDLTRGMIIANNDAELNRRLINAQNEIIELRHDGRGRDRARETEVNVTQIVSQNQAQQQQQQQFQVTHNLLQALLTQSQIATATNQQLIIGNSGVTAGGPQTANPVNVRA